jgi:RNA recognition motif-containing protein
MRRANSATLILNLSLTKGELTMNNKLYVGGLPYSTTENQLQELFAAHGSVQSARIITDKLTGRSKGFGFVEMSSASEAQNAISALDGKDFEGRNLTVNEARPQERRPPFGVQQEAQGGGGGRRRW